MTSDREIDKAEIVFFEELQRLIGSAIKKVPLSRNISTICGVDAAYSQKDYRVTSVAVVFADGRFEESSSYTGRFTFPYVSGLFFMHEGPFVVAAVRKLKHSPQLVCFDAHGLAHPRSMGLATMCGMILHIPSVGIAKSPLVGKVTDYHNEFSVMKYEGRR